MNTSQSRIPRILGAGLALVAATFSAGCWSESTEVANITLSIAGVEALESPLSDLSASAPGFAFSDVLRIRIDVKETATNTPLYVGFELLKSKGAWSGTLPFLPKRKRLTFTAHALDAALAELFSGVTLQTLTTDNERVAIVLAPDNDGRAITLPRVKKIAVPSQLSVNQAGNLSFFIEANSGETITFSVTAAKNGGAFFPDSGSLTLAGAVGTFVTQYAPPTVTAAVELTHELKVTNASGQSVRTTFKTTVLPLGSTQGARNTAVQVLWSPVITSLSAQRVADTGNILWQAVVTDDGPQSKLSYAWSFTPNGTFTPAPTFKAQTNPTTLRDYTPLVQGTLTLKVTDAHGGATAVSYPLLPNQFPDEPVEPPLFRSIHGGGLHTCALMTSGAVRCWGLGAFGQLGYGNGSNIGDNEQPYTAGDVPLQGKVVQLTTGGSHTCALMSNGAVRCWGLNAKGQLGYGHTRNIGDDEALSSAGDVHLGGKAVKLAAGHAHTCALLTTGKVRCWGLNSNGQLGYGNTNDIGDNEPPSAAGDVHVGGVVQDIVAGDAHTCALLATGKVRCWGDNSAGQLGYGNTTRIGDDERPAVAGDVNLGGTARQLAAGDQHTCALLDTGFVRCWGNNSFGQLGYGDVKTIGDDELPSTAGDVNTGGKVVQVSTGADHTCALLITGDIKCWGYGHHGQLGYGNPSDLSSPPTATVGLSGASAFQLTTGGNHTCALLITGKARCWGDGANGQLGYGDSRSIGDDELPSTAGDISVFAPTP